MLKSDIAIQTEDLINDVYLPAKLIKKYKNLLKTNSTEGWKYRLNKGYFNFDLVSEIKCIYAWYIIIDMVRKFDNDFSNRLSHEKTKGFVEFLKTFEFKKFFKTNTVVDDSGNIESKIILKYQMFIDVFSLYNEYSKLDENIDYIKNSIREHMSLLFD